jgi:hypothetical protein
MAAEATAGASQEVLGKDRRASQQKPFPEPLPHRGRRTQTLRHHSPVRNDAPNAPDIEAKHLARVRFSGCQCGACGVG